MPATDSFFRNLNKTHAVFAGNAIVLLLASLWMLHDDHNDEWRTWQQKWDRVEAARLTSVGNDQQDTLLRRQAQLNKQITQARNRAVTIKAELDSLESTLKKQVDAVAAALRVAKPLRTDRDVARANYDLAIRDNDTTATAKLEVFQQAQAQADAAEQDLRKAEDTAQATKASISKLQGVVGNDLQDLESLEALITLARDSRGTIAPEGNFQAFKRWLMEQPIVDGFNSHHKVRQDWLPGQQITLGMAKTARFDRCRTCHLGIDRVLAGNIAEFPHGDADPNDDPRKWVATANFPHPFATHPRSDVFVTASSPHPLTEFGCTVCHDGQGSATSFHHAQHGPDHPAEHEQWNREYGFNPNHFWEYPMQPRRLRESTCLKCHHTVIELGVNPKYGPTAPKLYRGWQLVQKFGCFGCHEITGFEGTTPIGPDLRLEPATAKQKAALDANPNQVAGRMRKVGPSLKHVARKTTEAWLNAWITEPKKFRPNTRMPQFFGLSNQADAHGTDFSPVEVAAVARYLLTQSKQAEGSEPLDQPPTGYKPDPKRGAIAFRERGCLACHSHDAVPDPDGKLSATSGPNLSKIHLKIRHDQGKQPGDPTDGGFRWLYSWIRNPQRHFPRTRMPDLFLDPQGKGDSLDDPAADIAAFLLSKGTGDYVDVDTGSDKFRKALDDLVKLYAGKVIGNVNAQAMVEDGKTYPEPDPEKISGDEKELAGPKLTHEMKLAYVGRRTISRYGCYGCHDIPGFETARPIGTKLEDWGRKDRSKLALEHIEEFLHHHGEPDGSSTRKRVDKEMQRSRAHTLSKKGIFTTDSEEETETRGAFFYGSLLKHGREGFLWQKLRDPRSYDYKKTETKGYDERLRMPRFTFDTNPDKNEEAIEAIATFILGLVAEPPPVKYVYAPDTRVADRLEGERLLQKYNCVGCHMLEAPEIRVRSTIANLPSAALAATDYPSGRDLLLKIRPARQIDLVADKNGQVEYSFHGLSVNRPDPDDTDLDPDEREYSYNLWEPIELRVTTTDKDGKPNTEIRTVLPAARLLVPEADLLEEKPARGGRFAQWLAQDIFSRSKDPNRDHAWQASPPPLIAEGVKVQTPWLYRFLKNPRQLRHTTVLRMPRFNIDDDEARALASYFAAADNADYPYQSVPQRQPDYLTRLNGEFKADAGHDYLTESWRLLNEPVCIKCHSLGGRPFKADDPKKDIRGPDLELARDRLQPDWVRVWLSNPKWITPYTSMPQPFARDQKDRLPPASPLRAHFDGDGLKQTISIRDALMNYNHLMQNVGKYIPPAKPKPAAGQQEAAQP
ncbi:MAG: hypothetical protein VB859_14900 [Planctomycetaceae bacterium]